MFEGLEYFTYFAYEKGGKPVGMGSLVCILETEIALLNGAATLPEYRNHGIFSATRVWESISKVRGFRTHHYPKKGKKESKTHKKRMKRQKFPRRRITSLCFNGCFSS
jgi:hypothetical protein